MKKANLLAAALAFVSINALAQPELVDVVITDKSGKTQLVSVERDNLSHFKNTKAQEGLWSKLILHYSLRHQKRIWPRKQLTCLQ